MIFIVDSLLPASKSGIVRNLNLISSSIVLTELNLIFTTRNHGEYKHSEKIMLM